MAVYKVELETLDGGHRVNGHVGHIVVATDAAGAKEVAQSVDGMPNDGRWDESTPLLLSSTHESSLETDRAEMSCVLNVSGAVAQTKEWNVSVKAGTADIAAIAVAIGTGGTGYSVNDVLTLVGGTFTHPCRLNVTSDSGGVIDGIEIIDPGVYSVFPADSVAVTGGGGSSADFDMTTNVAGMAGLMSLVVNALVVNSEFTGAQYTPADDIMIISTGAVDDLGDGTVGIVVNNIYGGVIATHVGAITDEGATSANLSVVMGAESVLVPTVVSSL